MTPSWHKFGSDLPFELAVILSGDGRDGILPILRTTPRAASYLCFEYRHSAGIRHARELDHAYLNMQELITCRQLADPTLHARVVGTLCLGRVSEQCRWWGNRGATIG